MKLHDKWSFILSLASLLALACYCLLAWLLIHRYNRSFDAGYIINYVLGENETSRRGRDASYRFFF